MDKATIIKSAVKTLMTTFQSGNFPAQIATTVIHKHAGDEIPSDKWTFANRLLMSAQGTNDARGYKQWQQVNRQVKRGSFAIHVFAPLTRKVTETDENTGEETSRIIVTGFRPLPVFRYEDTAGEQIISESTCRQRRKSSWIRKTRLFTITNFRTRCTTLLST